MHAPKIINIIYEYMVRSTATTVIIPRRQSILLRYEKNPHLFYNKERGFKVYLPEGWKVDALDHSEISEPNASGSISSFSPTKAAGMFRPKIELLIKQTDDIDSIGYFERLLDYYLNKQELIRYYIDEQFHAATFELAHSCPGKSRTFQIMKYFLFQGKAYIISVGELSAEHLEKEAQMLEEIKQIVQSFVFIEGASRYQSSGEFAAKAAAKGQVVSPERCQSCSR
ncbi:MAG: hypothetical protein ABSC17_05415 [Thermacetogeniaceae bacterium]